MRCHVIGICLVVAFGCSKANSDSSTPDSSTDDSSLSPATDASSNFNTPPTIRLTMTPGDLLSDVGGTPMMLRLDHLGANVPDSAVVGVTAAIKLRVYPELTPVPFTQSASPSGDDETAPRNIMVFPTGALSQAGWYVLSVDTVPDGVTPYSDTTPNLPQIGVGVGRFSVGSSPLLRLIQLASNGKVIVNFSEGILASPSQVAAALTVATSDSAMCSLLPTDFPNPSMQVGFQCAAIAWQTKHIHFVLGAGLKTPKGVALGYMHTSATSGATLIGLDTLTQDVDFSSLPEASNVRSWTATLP